MQTATGKVEVLLSSIGTSSQSRTGESGPRRLKGAALPPAGRLEAGDIATGRGVAIVV